MVVEADRRSQIYESLGREIRRARIPRTQDWLAHEIGSDQRTLSSYEGGLVRIPLDVVEKIEDALGLRRGELLVNAGLVEPASVPVETPVEEAVRTDPTLDGDGRGVVLHVLDYCHRVAADTFLSGLTPERREAFRQLTPAEQRDLMADLADHARGRDISEPRGA